MNQTQTHFLIRLFFFCGVVFGFHLLVLDYYNKDLFESLMLEAYGVNMVLAILIFFLLYQFRSRFKNQLGFLFLLGSLVKFLVFFLVFNSVYKEDNQISPQEFFAFFTPYTLTLIVEVFSLSKWMNKLES